MKHYLEMMDYVKVLNIPIITTNKKITYYNIPCGFDIETTSSYVNSNKVAFMYVWQIGIGYGDNNPVFYGRTWSEFVELVDELSSYFKTSESKRLVIYVHNLGYEFQFMRKYFEWSDVFSASERKPIRALTTNGIEFRDSYILSGHSLANVAKNLVNHNVKKLSGDLDYSLIRHHNTPLTPDEIAYCKNDIQIILAYITEEITLNGDISLIPMTNTGRVRKLVRDNCYYKNIDGTRANKGKTARYRKIMADLTVDVKTYSLLKRAFMGGFTHANALYTNQVLTDVTSLDFTSSYPSVMISEKFPMSRFKPVEIKTIAELDDYCDNHAVLMECHFVGLDSIIEQENYISESKCYDLINPLTNNGRIVKADSLSVVLTDVDYKIMKACYSWDKIAVTNVRYAHKNYLPKSIIESILKLYQDKTELKGVSGYEVEYLLSKGMLNSIYGMSVTDIVKPKAVYQDNDTWLTEIPDLESEIERYNKSYNRYLYYAWGIYVTAYARRNLWTGILATGMDYVYSDTDSLKILNYDEHKEYIKAFDDRIIQKMLTVCEYYNLDKKLLNPKTNQGVHKMLGVWDYEGTYSHFKTLGAKRYILQDGEKIEITVAGLSKQNGVQYMLDQCNGDSEKVFNMFNNQLYIPKDKTGKMTHSYLDDVQSFTITDYLGNVADVHSLSGVHLENCDFTLSMSEQYLSFIENLTKGYIYQGVDYV